MIKDKIGIEYQAESRLDIVAGAILPDGQILTGRIGCYYEGNNSGFWHSNLGQTVCIAYPDGQDDAKGYYFAEIA